MSAAPNRTEEPTRTEKAERARNLIDSITHSARREPDVGLTLTRVTDEEARAVVLAHPEMKWRADGSGSTDWISGSIPGVGRVMLFLLDEAPQARVPRGLTLLAEIAEERA